MSDYLDHKEFGPLDFVANILYQHHCEESKISPKRWYMLREDQQRVFRERAIQTVSSWAAEEIQQKRMVESATSILGKPSKK